jgi:hypothetical protein
VKFVKVDSHGGGDTLPEIANGIADAVAKAARISGKSKTASRLSVW